MSAAPDQEPSNIQRDLLKYSVEQFDKSIVYIASGAFIISFGFIKDVLPNLATACHKNWLITAWYIFALVIFISLIGHFVSYLGQSWSIKYHNLEEQRYGKIAKRWNDSIRAINVIMIAGILVGAIFLISFIKLNL